MVAVQAVFDGKEFKPVSLEAFPKVEKAVPVAIVFLDEIVATLREESRQETVKESQREIIMRMRAARDAMPPLEMSIPEMIEEGRER